MADDTPHLDFIVKRLEKLERQNRRFKQLGLGVALVLGTLLLMGQARPSRTVEAERFILKDAEGHTRAELAMATDPTPDGKSYFPSYPSLRLLDADGTQRISVGRAGFFIDNGESLVLKDATDPTKGYEYVRAPHVSLTDDGLIAIKGTESDNKTTPPFLNPTGGNQVLVDFDWRPEPGYPSLSFYSEDAKDGKRSKIEMSAHSDGPSLTFSDPTGFSAVLGSASLVTERTGETHRTSAASLVLFGKDGTRLWSAP